MADRVIPLRPFDRWTLSLAERRVTCSCRRSETNADGPEASTTQFRPYPSSAPTEDQGPVDEDAKNSSDLLLALQGRLMCSQLIAVDGQCQKQLDEDGGDLRG